MKRAVIGFPDLIHLRAFILKIRITTLAINPNNQTLTGYFTDDEIKMATTLYKGNILEMINYINDGDI